MDRSGEEMGTRVRYKTATIVLFAAGLLAGCGGNRCLAHWPRTGSAPSLTPPPPAPGSEDLQKSAYVCYTRGDYVRALRLAYRAAGRPSPDFRLPLLVGLIYDTGFGRPDLAIPEYRRFLRGYPSARRVQQRIGYLHRRAWERGATLALRPSASAPLPGASLAVYPFLPAGPRQPEPGLAPGLLDILFHGLEGPFGEDAMQRHVVVHVFRSARPNATPAEFSRWVGADRTLTGILIDLGGHRMQIVLQVFDAEGNLTYRSQPITGSLADLGPFYHDLLKGAAEGLGISLPSPLPQPAIASPLALLLYGQALEDYINGRLADARRRLADAYKLGSKSALIARALNRAKLEMAESHAGRAMIDVYRGLMTLPDPSDAVERRLQITHTLTMPPSSALTGTESIDPYKPPHTEVAP